MNDMKYLQNESLRYVIGNHVTGAAGLSIDATPADVETDSAVTLVIGGLSYALGAQSAIDLSTLTGAGEVVADGEACVFCLVSTSGGTISIVNDDPVDIADDYKTPLLDDPDVACFGIVLVENLSGSNFTFGTTSLATSGVTDSYFDVNVVPPTVPSGI